MHHQSKLIKKIKKRKEIYYLLHACSSLWMDIFGFKEIYSIIFEA